MDTLFAQESPPLENAHMRFSALLEALTPYSHDTENLDAQVLFDSLGNELSAYWSNRVNTTSFLSLGDIYLLVIQRIRWLRTKQKPLSALHGLVKHLECDAAIRQATCGMVRTYSALPKAQDRPILVPLDPETHSAISKSQGDQSFSPLTRSAYALQEFYSILQNWGVSLGLAHMATEAIAELCMASSRRGPNSRRTTLLTMLSDGELDLTGPPSAMVSWLYLIAGRRTAYQESLLWSLLSGQEVDKSILTPSEATCAPPLPYPHNLQHRWLTELAWHASNDSFQVRRGPSAAARQWFGPQTGKIG